MLGILLIAVIGVAVAICFRAFETGPRYKGQSVSYWREAIVAWNDGMLHIESVTGQIRGLLGLCDTNGKPSVLAGGLNTVPLLRILTMDEDRTVSRAALLRLAELLTEKDPKIRTSAAEVLRSCFGRGEECDEDVIVQTALVLELGDPTATAEILKLWTETAPAMPRKSRELEAVVLWRMISEGSFRELAMDAIKRVNPDRALEFGIP